jgi:2-oxo-3-hexenedioate decarboxylase
MTPETLLQHLDQASLWPADSVASIPNDVALAYQTALQVRQLRVQRGETPRGFKIGFTNRSIWERYQVFEPIWGTVWDTTLSYANTHGQGTVDISHMSQPRLEPELVFGMRRTPAADLSAQSLFEAIEWMACGFEIVQSHAADWRFKVADTITDSALHAHLLVGKTLAVRDVASDGEALHQLLSGLSLQLIHEEKTVETGHASNVLDSPLMALLHFLKALRQCPGAPEVQAGDVVTTGTWTDAWPIKAGQQWESRCDLPLTGLKISLSLGSEGA